MKKTILILAIITPLLLPAQENNSIIPKPVSLQTKSGSFIIDNNTVIKINAGNSELKTSVDFFKKAIRNTSGITLPLINAGKKILNSKLSIQQILAAKVIC